MRGMLNCFMGSFWEFLSSLTWFRKGQYLVAGGGVVVLLFIQVPYFAPDASVKSLPIEISSSLDNQVTSAALITVDHNSVDLFEQIPDEYIQAASALQMLFIDRSVGSNINDGLTCLGYPSDEDAPNHCKRYEHIVPSFSVDPSEVNWSRAGGYNRDNWEFLHWDEFPDSVRNANGNCSSWDQKTSCFIDYMESMPGPVINQYDVASFQFSYLLVGNGSTIEDQPGGFIWDNAALTDVYDLEAFEARHPAKTVIYWTTSLARPTGTVEAETFNNQMRQYANDNNKILFDVADILSHDPYGNPCYDSRDGVPYDNGNSSENYPDDGVDILAICQYYTSEVDGGHLGNVSAGKIRVAKAFWVLMAQIAGWNPGSTSTPPSVRSVIPANNTTDVPRNRSLIITFSEAMSTDTVTYTFSPNPGGVSPSWNGSNTQLILNHNDFSANTDYTVSITAGRDLSGEPLDNAPYTWNFTTGTQMIEFDWTYLPVVIKN